MTEEEKKAINDLDKFADVVTVILPDYSTKIPEYCIDEQTWLALKKALNLIQKQDTEIKELIDFNKKLQATKDRLDKYDKENTIKFKKQDTEINKLNNVIDRMSTFINSSFMIPKEYFMKEDK